MKKIELKIIGKINLDKNYEVRCISVNCPESIKCRLFTDKIDGVVRDYYENKKCNYFLPKKNEKDSI